MMDKLTKEYYLGLPYLWDFEPRQEGKDCYFVAFLRDIPRVCADGVTKEEARLHLHEAFSDYLDWRLECGFDIPQTSTPYAEQACEVVRPLVMASRPSVAESATLESGREKTVGSLLPSETVECEPIECVAAGGR